MAVLYNFNVKDETNSIINIFMEIKKIYKNIL